MLDKYRVYINNTTNGWTNITPTRRLNQERDTIHTKAVYSSCSQRNEFNGVAGVQVLDILGEQNVHVPKFLPDHDAGKHPENY